MVYRRRHANRRPRQKVGRRPVRARRPMRRRAVPRGLRQAIMPFQREHTTFVNTKSTLPAGWSYGTAANYHTVRHTMVFSLSQLPDINEFFTLFKSYKLNCVVVKISMLHNSSMFTAGSNPNYYGGNLQVYAQKNTFGVALDSAITQDYWDQQAAKKSYLMTGNRVLTFKIYPKVMSKAYLDATHDMIVQKSPPWIPISTDGVALPHFGLNLQFSYVNPEIPFDNTAVPDSGRAPLNFKVQYKYLFQMRGVK